MCVVLNTIFQQISLPQHLLQQVLFIFSTAAPASTGPFHSLYRSTCFNISLYRSTCFDRSFSFAILGK
jgi:hypothetical protein